MLISKLNNKQYFILFNILFLVFLIKGVWSSSWYESSRLVVKGLALRQIANLTVKWDSGNGYNSYESRAISLSVPKKMDSGLQHIRIRALGEKHPQSRSNVVSILKIVLDGKEFDLKSIRPRTLFWDRLAIHLTENDPAFQFDSVFEFWAPVDEHIRIVLANSFYYGKVAIEINGVVSNHDLYISGNRYEAIPYDFYLVKPNGAFSFDIGLPRYEIEKLAIKNNNPDLPASILSVSVCHQEECIDLVTGEGKTLDTNYFLKPNAGFKYFFDLKRFILRCLFAALSSIIVISIIRYLASLGGIIPALTSSKRPAFWVFFISLFTVNFLFLLSFWPGLMSQDSLVIWRAAGLPEIYLNSHPVLNMLFYMYLMGIWNNPAVVPLTQILFSSALSAFIFYWTYKKGVPILAIIPFFLMALMSIPVNLYNIALWKDIPFALLAVFWGFVFTVLFHEKRDKGVMFTWWHWLILLSAYLGLCFFRHNGVVYIFVVPFFFILTGVFSWKKSLAVSFIILLSIGALVFALQNMESYKGKQSFVKQTITSHLRKIKKKSVTQEIVRSGREYFDIFDMEKEGTVSDRWHNFMHDRYSWNFLIKVGYWDFYPYEIRPDIIPGIRNFIWAMYSKSYESPWKYLVWNPLYYLFIVPLAVVCCRWLPGTAIFSGFLLCGVIPLLFLNIFNWRYYYFFYYGLSFMGPLIMFDLKFHKRRSGKGR